MVKEQQSSGMICHIQSTDGDMVDDGMSDDAKVELQIMGKDGEHPG